MSDLLGILFFISILFLITAYVFGGREKRESNKRRKKLRRMMERCSHEGNIRPLLKAYMENEIAAEAKYIGTIVRVKGTVQKVTTGEMSEYDLPKSVVYLSAYGAYVSCFMPESEKEQLMEIRVTDKVCVYGTVVGFGLNPDCLILKDCLIQTEKEELDGHQ